MGTQKPEHARSSAKGGVKILCQVIKQLRVAIEETRRGELAADVLLLHGNVPVHKSRVAQAQGGHTFLAIKFPDFSLI